MSNHEEINYRLDEAYTTVADLQQQLTAEREVRQKAEQRAKDLSDQAEKDQANIQRLQALNDTFVGIEQRAESAEKACAEIRACLTNFQADANETNARLALTAIQGVLQATDVGTDYIHKSKLEDAEAECDDMRRDLEGGVDFVPKRKLIEVEKACAEIRDRIHSLPELNLDNYCDVEVRNLQDAIYGLWQLSKSTNIGSNYVHKSALKKAVDVVKFCVESMKLHQIGGVWNHHDALTLSVAEKFLKGADETA